MGGICSRSSTVDNAPSGTFAQPNELVYQESHGNLNAGSVLTAPTTGENMGKHVEESFSFPEINTNAYGTNQNNVEDGIPRLSRALSHKSRSVKYRPAAVAKVSEVSSLLVRTGTVGLGKAVDVLDTLGSSMTNLNLSSEFAHGTTTKGNKISILAFEVAILMQSLSKETENI